MFQPAPPLKATSLRSIPTTIPRVWILEYLSFFFFQLSFLTLTNTLEWWAMKLLVVVDTCGIRNNIIIMAAGAPYCKKGPMSSPFCTFYIHFVLYVNTTACIQRWTKESVEEIGSNQETPSICNNHPFRYNVTNLFTWLSNASSRVFLPCQQIPYSIVKRSVGRTVFPGVQ